LAQRNEFGFGSLQLVDFEFGDSFVEFQVAIDFNELIFPDLKLLDIFLELMLIFLVLLGQLDHPLVFPILHQVKLLQALNLNPINVVAELLDRHLPETLFVL
jgi:hypothetical protein